MTAMVWAEQFSTTATLPLVTPTDQINTLDVAVAAQGMVEVPADTPLIGGQTVNVDDSDEATSTISGSLLVDFVVDVDPTTKEAQPVSIAFRESPIMLDEDVQLNLSLGSVQTFLGPIAVGSVVVDAKDVVATANTPDPPGSVMGTEFPLPPHELILYQGTIDGVVNGLAAGIVDDISVDLAEAPLMGAIGTGNGMVTFSSPMVDGLMVSYEVVITVPAAFSSLVTEDPVNVTVTTDGTVEARGTVTVELPPMEVSIEVVDVAANTPAVDDLTLTFSSAGGPATFTVLSTSDLALPLAQWTVEDPALGNQGETTQFTDVGVLGSGGQKYYLVQAN
jgi:hypothetical protein